MVDNTAQDYLNYEFDKEIKKVIRDGKQKCLKP